MEMKAYERPEIRVVDIQCGNLMLNGSDKVQIGGNTLNRGDGDPDDID